jgi:hypothetical protein
MAEGTGKGEALSIWFFVGIMTLAYGLALFPYGLWAWLTGHEAHTVMHQLHPTVWWGALLTLFGGFYTIRYRPHSGR